jgi:glycosyltransferase involved in cell wall biosynthesis
MRIVNVTPYTVNPRPVGGAVRIASLMSRLAAEHEVTGFSVGRGMPGRAPLASVEVCPSYTEMQFSGRAASLLASAAASTWVRSPIFSGLALSISRPPSLIRLLRSADIVIVDYPWQFGFCRRNSRGMPVVYASHNVETEKFRSHREIVGGPWERSLLALIRRMEEHAVTAADLVLTVSDRDRDAIIGRFGAPPSRVVTVPDGADTRRFRPASAGERHRARRELGLPDRPTVYFAGGAGMPPNQAAASWVRRIAALAGHLTFLILGAVGRPAIEGNVVVTGVVDDVAPYLRASDAALVPVAHGGGVKLKLIESLAAGLPTIAFPEALRGTRFRDGVHVVTAAKDEAALLAALSRVLEDPALAARLAGEGRAAACEWYDWDLISAGLSSVLGDLPSRREGLAGREQGRPRGALAWKAHGDVDAAPPGEGEPAVRIAQVIDQQDVAGLPLDRALVTPECLLYLGDHRVRYRRAVPEERLPRQPALAEQLGQPRAEPGPKVARVKQVKLVEPHRRAGLLVHQRSRTVMRYPHGPVRHLFD